MEVLANVHLVCERISVKITTLDSQVWYLRQGFDEQDVKGMYDVRTFIAHDYEGVNLAIIEWIIRNHKIPALDRHIQAELKKIIQSGEKELPLS